MISDVKDQGGTGPAVGRLCSGRVSLRARPRYLRNSTPCHVLEDPAAAEIKPRPSDTLNSTRTSDIRSVASWDSTSTMELFGSLVDVSAILQDRILSLLHILTPQRRIMIALAGVPGAGKSTIASILLERLHEAGVCDVVVAPMVSPTFAYEKINSCR
jgi:hypothetical protein